MITLQPLTPADVMAIRQWPPYPERLMALDYALRQGGWLDQFPESPITRRFALRQGDDLVGFSILTDICKDEAEFYIALHPQHLGRGIGRSATVQTVRVGFETLGLRRIYLKVRDWHREAQRLYESCGFRPSGHCVANTQGQPVHFVSMEMLRPEMTHNQ